MSERDESVLYISRCPLENKEVLLEENAIIRARQQGKSLRPAACSMFKLGSYHMIGIISDHRTTVVSWLMNSVFFFATAHRNTAPLYVLAA